MGQRRTIAEKRILITGCSQGIGRALALEAASLGGRVLATARTLPSLQELAREAQDLGTPIEILEADVTSSDDRRQMLANMLKLWGGLDILINNAGIGATGHFGDASEERLRAIFEVNFFGLAELTRLAFPLLKSSANEGQRPAVVNISSIVGKRGLPGRSEYSASKFAVQGFSEAIRGEFSLHGIDVLIVSPGLTQTNFPKNMLERKSKLQVDHLRGMTASDVAQQTFQAILRGKNETTLSGRGKLFVAVTRFFPRLVDRLVNRRVKRLYAQQDYSST